MLINQNKNFKKFRSPSAINIHSNKINHIKKNMFSPRITSAINSPKINNINPNFNSKLFFKPNSTFLNFNSRKLQKRNFSPTNIYSNNNYNFSFNSPKNNSFNNNNISSGNQNSNLILKKNIFEYYYNQGKERFEEENKKIQSVLTELLIWDNKQLIENNESFKAAKIYCDEIKERLKNEKKKNTEKSQAYSDKKFRWIFNNDDKNRNNFELKFSVFDKNYDINKAKKEEDKKKQKLLKDLKNNLENNLKKVTQKDSILEIQKERSNFENSNKDQLMKTYKYIIANKLKKRKYKEIMESTYYLLNQARNECKLSVDLLKERIKSVQKYYEAYIESMNRINKGNESETKKLNYMEKYEEKVNKYREYLSIYEEINKEIKAYEDKYELVKKDLESFIIQIKTKMQKIIDEINKNKYLFNELKEQQIEYYLEKLKKGTDTRNEGLSWIVKKLMELKTNIEPNLFPNFLDKEQINYIIQISKLGFECNQLKLICKSLRDKTPEFIKHKSIDKNNNIIKNKKVFLKEIKDNCLAEDIDFEVEFNDCFEELIKEKGEINKKITDLLEKFSKKEGISPLIKYKIEDKKLNDITLKIKKKINNYANTRDNKLFENKEKNRDNLIKCIFGEGKEKDYFEDIFLMSDRAKKLDEIIYKLKKEEYLIFLEKMKLYETKESISKLYYVKIFSALFGSSNFEIISKFN